jgi:predicted GIY-YIG superfamily endonuclease
MPHHVNILRCSDDSYYIGTTQDLATREATHNEGRDALHTRLRRPVKLVYSEQLSTHAAAIRRERQLKRWTRAKKKALVAGDLTALNRLGRSHR